MRKAQRLNRRMMWSMLAMAVVLLAVVFAMFYYSFENQQANRPQAEGDTIVVEIQK